MMNRRKAAWIAAVALWALLLAPFFFGARAAHPATDDFTFAVYTHPTWLQTHSLPHVIKDAISYALRTWRDWQGTVTGVIVMALNPAVFSIGSYGAHAVFLLVLQLIADFVFLRRMLGTRLRLPRGTWLSLYLLLSAMRLLFLPDIVEGIYWFNGAWFYTGAQAVALLTLTLADTLCECLKDGSSPAVRAARWLICCGLLFALGMDNYITAMMTAAALFMMALQRAYVSRKQAAGGVCDADKERAARNGAESARQRRVALRTALLLIPVCAGLLLSIAAPGNAVRMAADGAHESGIAYALLSIARTALAALGYIARFLVRTPLLQLLIAATPFLVLASQSTAPELRRLCPPVPAILAGFYLILCAMIVPHMYASGYAGSGRVVNMYHDYVLLAAPIAWFMILLRLKPWTRSLLANALPCAAGDWRCAIDERETDGTRLRQALRHVKAVYVTLLLVTMSLWLAGGQLANYAKLVGDQLDGTQAAYIAQFQNEYALCEAAGPEDDVLLPAWTVQTVTGKPTVYEDATVWTNESMANYFGVRSVRSVALPEQPID